MANPKIHFLKLVNLFEGYTPIFPTLRFNIEGDYTHFTIKKVHGYPYLFAGLFVLLVIIPFLIMIPVNYGNPRFWLMEVILMGIAYTVFTFFVVSRSIIVDLTEEILVLDKKNIFKSSITKPIPIQFPEFKEFISKTKSRTVNKFGQKVVYQRIYILYKDKKEFLMDLPGNFQTSDGAKTFTDYLENIIGKDG
ncbi:MAG: hypothetical protein R2819_04630 [Allomuricauda sp.]